MRVGMRKEDGMMKGRGGWVEKSETNKVGWVTRRTADNN